MNERTARRTTQPMNARRTDAWKGAGVSDHFRLRLREERGRRAAERRLGGEEAEGHPECRAQSARFRVSDVSIFGFCAVLQGGFA